MSRFLPLALFTACAVAPGGTEPADTDTGATTSGTVELEVGDCDIYVGAAREDVRELPVATVDHALVPDLAVRVIRSTAEHDAWVAETGLEVDLSTVDFATESVAVGVYYPSYSTVVETALTVHMGDDDAHVAFDARDHGATCATHLLTSYHLVQALAVPALAGTVTACAAMHGTCD